MSVEGRKILLVVFTTLILPGGFFDFVFRRDGCVSRLTSRMIFCQTRILNIQSVILADVYVSSNFLTRSIAFFMFSLCDASGAHVSCMYMWPAHFNCSGKCRLP